MNVSSKWLNKAINTEIEDTLAAGFTPPTRLEVYQAMKQVLEDGHLAPGYSRELEREVKQFLFNCLYHGMWPNDDLETDYWAQRACRNR